VSEANYLSLTIFLVLRYKRTAKQLN